MKRFKAVKVAALAAASALVMSGCSVDPYSLPLPGGADTGDNPMTLKIEMRDVMDLTNQGSVRLNDASIGKITKIQRDGWNAVVTVRIQGDADLPANTTSTIRQTSLLGEKFVSLEVPEKPEGTLRDGDTIPIEHTGRNPEVEEVLGAASLLFNGGGVDKVNTIVKELNLTLEGNEPQVKELLNSADSFLGQLDARKAEIITTLEQVNSLTTQVNAQKGTIDAALANLPGALQVLNDQRDDLVSMLNSLGQLGDSATGVVKQMRADLLANLASIQPILQNLTAAAPYLAGNLSTMLTFPFPDSMFGSQLPSTVPECSGDVAATDISCAGDWQNLHVTLNLTPDQLCTGFGLSVFCSLGGSPTTAATAAGTDPLVDIVSRLVPTTTTTAPTTTGAAPTTTSPTTTSTNPLCTLLGSCRAAPSGSSDLELLLLGSEATR